MRNKQNAHIAKDPKKCMLALYFFYNIHKWQVKSKWSNKRRKRKRRERKNIRVKKEMVFIPCTCQRRGWPGWLTFGKAKATSLRNLSPSLSFLSLIFMGFCFRPLFSFLYKSMPWDEKIRGWCRHWTRVGKEMGGNGAKAVNCDPFCLCSLRWMLPTAEISMPTHVSSLLCLPPSLSLSRSRLFASSPLHFSSFGFLHFGHPPFVFLGVSGLLRPDRCGVEFSSTS